MRVICGILSNAGYGTIHPVFLKETKEMNRMFARVFLAAIVATTTPAFAAGSKIQGGVRVPDPGATPAFPAHCFKVGNDTTLKGVSFSCLGVNGKGRIGFTVPVKDPNYGNWSDAPTEVDCTVLPSKVFTTEPPATCPAVKGS